MLIVDDDRELQALICLELETSNYEVISAFDGAEGLSLAVSQRPDLVILDVNLPSMDGLSVCRELRSRSTVPILMLSSLKEDHDRIVGLEVGADDYLGKPFNPRELLARIRAILRRTQLVPATDEPPRRRRRFGEFLIDLDMRALEVAGRRVAVTAAEFDLLACFVVHPRRVLSRDQLLDWTRGRMADPFDRTIDVSVSRLRRKLIEASPGAETLITTVRNGGYLFAGEPREE